MPQSLEEVIRTTITNAIAQNGGQGLAPAEITAVSRVAASVIERNEHLLSGTEEQRGQLASLLTTALMADRETRTILRNGAGVIAASQGGAVLAGYNAASFTGVWEPVDSQIRERVPAALLSAISANREAITEGLAATAAERARQRDQQRQDRIRARELRDLERNPQGAITAALDHRGNLGQLSPTVLVRAIPSDPDRGQSA